MSTVSEVLLVGSVILVCLAAVLRIVAPLTKTTKDDEALKLAERVEPLAQSVIDKAKADEAKAEKASK